MSTKTSADQLAGLVRRKPVATRPAEAPQRAPDQSTDAAPLQARRPDKVWALTLKLDEPTYRRMKRFSVETDRSHQDILAAAVREYLERHWGEWEKNKP